MHLEVLPMRLAPPVDKAQRKAYADILQRFLDFELTNDEYEDLYYDMGDKTTSGDPAVLEIFHQVWGLYDDRYTHKLCGKYKPTNEDLEFVQRCILFLNSHEPFLWRSAFRVGFCQSVVFLFLNLLIHTTGLFQRLKYKIHYNAFGMDGCLDVWPFYHREDYERESARTKS